LRQKLIITDLTQMPSGDEACVVGINEKGQTIRPVHDKGFLKRYLYQNSKLIIFPRAIVEFDLIEARPQPPHIEDVSFNPAYIKFCGKYDDKHWENILLTNSFSTMDAMYEGNLRYDKWVAPGTNTRSIATLSNTCNHSFAIEAGRAPKPRLHFRESSDKEFNLPVSDLAIRELCYSKVKRKGESTEYVVEKLNKSLAQVRSVYLRIGLARPYKPVGAEIEHCYLQITGIHTIPDYLHGKTFADFADPTQRYY